MQARYMHVTQHCVQATPEYVPVGNLGMRGRLHTGRNARVKPSMGYALRALGRRGLGDLIVEQLAQIYGPRQERCLIAAERQEEKDSPGKPSC
mmetsp:Transcript_36288/g.79325  ORF Transcript_36288/g.79325 Transcript_36288/m.79325 type:complete len:93 (-) Transcript_36288:159-437(-)